MWSVMSRNKFRAPLDLFLRLRRRYGRRGPHYQFAYGGSAQAEGPRSGPTPFLSGLLFGLGLILSGMTDPARVLAFLDVTGDWNPALAIIMAGAVAVTLPAFALARRRGRTFSGRPIELPDRRTITVRLIAGSAFFGVGWGLVGVCPGPALVIAAGGGREPLIFLGSLLAGIAMQRLLFRPGPHEE